MATKSASTQPAKRNAPAPESVEAFLTALDHPFKAEILALRQIILAVDSSIAEDIKWNAPSFSTSEHFATFQLRAKDSVQIILHLGAKTRATAITGVVIDDPEALLKWLAKDRAAVTFRDLNDIDARRAAFAQLIRQWITYV